MRLYGLATNKDEIKAAELFRRAAEKGNPDAESAMGMLLYQGQGENSNDCPPPLPQSFVTLRGGPE